MAADWKESFDKSLFSNQFEHIYAAGWKAAKAEEALKTSYNKQSTPLEIEPTLEPQIYGSNGPFGYKKVSG